MNRAERRRQLKAARGPASKREAALAQAARQLGSGQPERAYQVLTRLLAADENDLDALHFAGVAKYQLGDYDAAMGHLDQAIELAPTYAEAHNSLGILHLEAGRADKAADCFRQAVAHRSDYANAYTNLGNALRDGDALEEAVDAYLHALTQDPTATQPAYRLAATLISLGRAEDALGAIEACLSIDPWCQNALASKGIALQMTGALNEAQALHDFDHLVQPVEIEPPSEYDSIQAFNDVLAQAVHDNPSLTWEPLNRVTRHGAVTQDMLVKPIKPIRQFEQALRNAIDRYRDHLVADPEHPFLNRIPERYRLTFIASILKEGGWHPSHIHESAWLSGVYYVDVPLAVAESATVGDGATEATTEDGGWLEFGQPDYQLPEGLKPFTKKFQPVSGLARFFPSYFFHGTIPFAGDGERIGIAFDVYPDV